jgi:tripartite-type tricarboxylate transporter receptor subunit TctC
MKKQISIPRRVMLAACIGITGLLAFPQAQAADAYPNRPVRVIVSFAPGGVVDVLARLVTTPLQQALGQAVIVDNRPGANGNIGGGLVAQAPADGYTLLMSSGGTVSVNPFIYSKMPFDPNKDIVPVASVARVAVFLVVRNDLPVNNAREFIAYVKANPGKLSYGSPGNGSSPHLAAEMFNSMAGLSSVHVPYKGAAPALQDLLGGQIDYTFDPGISLNYAKAGKLKLLAVGSPSRVAITPDTPTIEEATGLKGYDADSYFGFYAPAGTPKAVINRLNTEITKIVNSPEIQERINALGATPVAMTPKQFADQAIEEAQRFGPIIKARGIKGD